MKKKILLVCGGRSVEHEVSLRSCRHIAQLIDRTCYDVFVWGIDRQGEGYSLEQEDLERLSEITGGDDLASAFLTRQGSSAVLQNARTGEAVAIDVVFPVIHGLMGEDGVLQGFLNFLNVPYVGCNVSSSALCMNKRLAREIMVYRNIPVLPFMPVTPLDVPSYSEACACLKSSVLFVKACRQGSSVGVFKVRSAQEYDRAILAAFKYDDEVLIERFIQGFEVECSVFQGQELVASRPAEIECRHDFYSYDAKYLDPEGAVFHLPARLPLPIEELVRDLSKKAFQGLGCFGMARVDFLISKDFDIYVSELNTIPGFTEISLYLRMLQTVGLEASQVVFQLLQGAQQRWEKEQQYSLVPVEQGMFTFKEDGLCF